MPRTTSLAANPDRDRMAWRGIGLLTLASAAALALASAASGQDAAMAEQQVSFTSAEGADVGTATLTGTPHGVLIRLDLHDLPPDGWHGFHVHENGECDAEGGFQSAGGHYAISATEHGFHTEGGPHAGDMPNQYVGPDGTLKSEVFNTFVVLEGEAADLSGRALILHAGTDDYESQPSGDAGDRLACAVIE